MKEILNLETPVKYSLAPSFFWAIVWPAHSPLSDSFSVQLQRFSLILQYSVALAVETAKIEQRLWFVLFNCPLIPVYRLFQIVFYTYAVSVHKPNHRLGFCMPCFPCLPMPGSRNFKISRYSQALAIDMGQLILNKRWLLTKKADQIFTFIRLFILA